MMMMMTMTMVMMMMMMMMMTNPEEQVFHPLFKALSLH